MIGEKLKTLRIHKNMTITQLEVLSGISNSLISQIETGKKDNPTANTIIALCNALDISADWLLLNKQPVNYTNEDNDFIRRYNKLTDREKGRIDQLLDEIEKTKIYETAGNL